MKEEVPMKINYIPDVMSEFDCRVLIMMKFRRMVKRWHENFGLDDDLKEIEKFILSNRFTLQIY
jgi:hypothetical protein